LEKKVDQFFIVSWYLGIFTSLENGARG
jgi:hypothetical protein